MRIDEDDVRVSRLVDELCESFRRTAEELVPSFFAHMPPEYFRDTEESAQRQHLRAIVAAKASGVTPQMTLVSQDGNIWTFIQERDHPGVLAELIKLLPRDRELRSAKVHSRQDGNLVLDVFRFGELPRFDPNNLDHAQKRAEVFEWALRSDPSVDLQALARHFDCCTVEYLQSVSVARIHHHFSMVHRVLGTDDTFVDQSPHESPRLRRIDIVSGSGDTRVLFERVVRHLGRCSVNIQRAYLDVFVGSDGPSVSVVGLVVDDDPRLDPASDSWRELRFELTRLRWLHERVLHLAATYPSLGLIRSEVLVALTHLAHARFGREDPFAFARERLYQILERHHELAQQIADTFAVRFQPRFPGSSRSEAGSSSATDVPNGPNEPARPNVPNVSDGLSASLSSLHKRIDNEVDEETRRIFLHFLVDAVQNTLRTNAFLEHRYGLSLRLSPSLLVSSRQTVPPHGVFFVHGLGADGFHVRFREIARGGVRVVRTLGPEQHGVEAERLYDEAYGLAYAQQLKNKDIPEGGAKGVILLEPGQAGGTGVKIFIDGLLDLLSPDAATRARIVDYLDRDEMLYLGPDEGVSVELIDWIVERARRRSHPMPNAFMSSKKDAGINHKEFGVTSEGVIVFLEEALREIGIDPRRDPFTVKMTGGPDGDVAGNCLAILFREFRDTARIVGIADGSGSAEDPDGLPPTELLLLVRESRPIAALDPTKLGPQGRVVPISARDGLRLRNSLHHRLRADAFIPAGGRPNTIHGGNWRDFLTEEGTPSSRIIVEGANLFLNDEARRALSQEAKVLIVKDSSANKCGVITSSHEVVASILLPPAVFLANKARFVTETLEKLRELARLEAQLLFREHRRGGALSLPDLSIELSKTVLRASDAILEYLSRRPMDYGAIAGPLIESHLPRVLFEVVPAEAMDRLPPEHKLGMVSKRLAAFIVYREGLDFLRGLEGDDLARLAVDYWQQDQRVRELASSIEISSLENRFEIGALLRAGGARAAVFARPKPQPANR